VDPRAGLDAMEERRFLSLPGFQLRPLDRPAHSKWLYKILYPGFNKISPQSLYLKTIKRQYIYSSTENSEAVLVFECNNAGLKKPCEYTSDLSAFL
jgi:hypothetical protein